uniref:Uncharacterized protein n=7 Tax=Vibrionaceae TaxID=641 RepID=A0A0H3ZNE7_9VIBR|nr:hypothetical protein [Vibrio splendidus]AKN36654.1 hypothetical protein [Vibrio sp. FF_482]AKN37828.1 hypothetical protein [Vibrio tasmaniensis]AKN38738.1 hypothetical protein [Enterovibrio norvegicus]AKN38961.1 hypothetical protein [Aliivibrio fischeri]AKN39128.1 hypothetical protein [Vibrio kanaloae]AKN39955.1 hypothetical protein [Vibrio sp. FF_307]
MFREYDEEGDIKAGTFWRERDSVGANISTQIQQWVRENPFDLSQGIDWQTEFNYYNEGRLSGQIRDIAFKCANVTAVSQAVTFSPIEDRKVNVSFSVRTIYGDQKVGVSVNANSY